MSAIVALSGLVFFIMLLPALLACTYLLVLTLLSAAPRPSGEAQRTRRFDILVPAHNEAQVIARTL